MTRKFFVVAPNTVIDAAVRSAAQAQGCTEIAQGMPPRLAREGVTTAYPFVYTEPDDPTAPGLLLAVTQLRNTFNTNRNAAQINNSLDALTVLLRRLAKNEMDR